MTNLIHSFYSEINRQIASLPLDAIDEPEKFKESNAYVMPVEFLVQKVFCTKKLALLQ